MPSSGRVQLNLSVEPQTREDLKNLCDKEGVSLAQAIANFVEASMKVGHLLGSEDASASPNVITEDKVKEMLKALQNELEQKIEAKSQA